MKKITYLLFCILCLVGCSSGSNGEQPKSDEHILQMDIVDADYVPSVMIKRADWGICTLTYDGESHDYVFFTNLDYRGSSGMSHWEGCRFCKMKK